MDKLLGWVRQPSTLAAAGLLLGAGVYWLTRDPSLALAAAAVPLGGVSDHTKQLLVRIEQLEDALRRQTPPKS